MKTQLLTTTFIGSLLLLSACNKHNNTTDVLTTAASDTLTAAHPTVKKALLKEDENVFVTASAGTLLYQTASIENKAIGNIAYGTAVKIIRIEKEFAVVNAYLSKTEIRNGQSYEQRSWEDVYTPLVNLGNRSELQILSEHLYDAIDYEKSGEGVIRIKASALKKYANIELIDEAAYLTAFKNKTSDFVDRKPIAKKENNALHISSGSNLFVLMDDDNTESDNYSVNDYIGYIPFLNSYLIHETLYEGESYNLYSKEASKITHNFYGFPYIAPSKSQLITMDYDPYEAATEMALCNITNGKISVLGSSDYLTGFSPFYDDDENKITRFWSSDNAFYLKVVHPTLAMDNGETYNSPIVPQYLRIKFK